MNLYEWALKWGVPPQAVEDLRGQFGLISTDPNPHQGESEAAIQTRIRLEASRTGARLWRNNVGAYDARFPPSPGTRWGLCNDTQAQNQVLKSADLVGIKPVLVQPYHVGTTLGVFLAREVKAGDWKFTNSDREVAQLNFLNLVASLGGDAAFANSEGTL